MGLNPIRHELRRELQLHLPSLGAEASEADRAQPTVKGAGAAVAAKPGSDEVPSRNDRFGNRGSGKQSYTTGRRLAHARTPSFLCRRMRRYAKQTLPAPANTPR